MEPGPDIGLEPAAAIPLAGEAYHLAPPIPEGDAGAPGTATCTGGTRLPSSGRIDSLDTFPTTSHENGSQAILFSGSDIWSDIGTWSWGLSTDIGDYEGDSAMTDAAEAQGSHVPCVGAQRDMSPDGLGASAGVFARCGSTRQLSDLPNEVLLQILGYLDVSDLLSTSRTTHYLRDLSLAPILHQLRLRRAREILPPLLTSPSRPSLADLIARSIFLTRTTVVSRQLARSLASIRLAHRLAARPSPEALVARCVLPPECAPGHGLDGAGLVAPALVAKKRAVERERVKDGLRRWVGSVWRGEVRTREEGVRRWEERVGIGRVWRLRRFWERVSKGEET